MRWMYDSFLLSLKHNAYSYSFFMTSNKVWKYFSIFHKLKWLNHFFSNTHYITEKASECKITEFMTQDKLSLILVLVAKNYIISLGLFPSLQELCSPAATKQIGPSKSLNACAPSLPWSSWSAWNESSHASSIWSEGNGFIFPRSWDWRKLRWKSGFKIEE